MRPCSSRKTRAMISRASPEGASTVTGHEDTSDALRFRLLIELHQWPYLYRPVLGRWDLGCPVERLVQVLALEDVEAAQLLLGLGEGTVGRLALPVADAHGSGQVGPLERVSCVHHAGFRDRI